MKRLAMIAPALMLATALQPVHAADKPKQPVPIEKTRLADASQKLDATRGYIAISDHQRLFGTFLRVPDDETMAAYRADVVKAMAKAKKHYASALETWEADVKTAAQLKQPAPAKPVEPTEETLGVMVPELRDMVTIGPMFIFAKDASSFTYLHEVKPGTYVYYGGLMAAPSGALMGACTCMGTVAFEVKAGVVTDLGNTLNQQAEIDPHAVLMTGKPTDVKLLEKQRAKGPTAGVEGLPQGWDVVPAEFHAYRKINNYYGVFVTRVGAIPGVLAYHRDKVVDARTGQELPDPLITSRQKPKL